MAIVIEKLYPENYKRKEGFMNFTWLSMHCCVWAIMGCIAVWAIIMTVFCFVWNPLPFPDWGHRCFAVPNEKATKMVVKILGELAGLKERFSFDVGSTHQTLLVDNTTVIIYHNGGYVCEQEFTPNGLSVVVRNPHLSALSAAETLHQAGFSFKFKYDTEFGDKLVILTSNAFLGWAMVFRRHVLCIGKPKNIRKLLV